MDGIAEHAWGGERQLAVDFRDAPGVPAMAACDRGRARCTLRLAWGTSS
jgi:hypothetical protein